MRFTFTVTIEANNADSIEDAREELAGGLEDAQDSGYIESFSIEEV